MSTVRKIVHVDMDAFFAAVEQRENPELSGKAVIVGGSPEGRGVVASASYEARAFGIRSAMASSQAVRLCPEAVFVRPRIALYRKVSQEIMEIFHEYTDLVEPLSVDEAYLDVTENKKSLPTATAVATEIKHEIFNRTSLTASAGVAPNKFLAKVASDLNKPDGLTIIKPSMVSAVLEDLPVRKVPGIGKVTEKKMATLGIKTTGDLQKKNQEELTKLFGKVGAWYYRIARGIDTRPVLTERTRKSISCEDTFAEDSTDLNHLRDRLTILAERLSRRLEKVGTSGRTITLKITYDDFEKITRSRTLSHSVCDPASLEETAYSLLSNTEAGERAIRLLGIGVSNLDLDEKQEEETEISGPIQLELPFVSNSDR